ncbi:hypothetical protein GIW81_12865 [Hyphomicrobium sp. xq]|uniref:DUF4760 domain-containing protein n=1 Tax=Hyphomicrobium album TaxID=2665159 RepID=A0A6I3KJF8_9HYPH|nr:hypothetical protein [Hyphomicrobium album]MTD95224.1 hypothetical protein [Hyphomicrobium album]
MSFSQLRSVRRAPSPEADSSAPSGWKRFRAVLGAYLLNGGLAAHVQAAAAVVAVGLAIYTLNTWKTQERAKKRSELAFEILSRTMYAAGEVRELLGWGDIDLQSNDAEAFLKRVIASDDRARFKQLSGKMSELDLYRTVAGFTVRNGPLDADLLFISSSIKRLDGCYDELDRMSRTDVGARPEVWQTMVISQARDLGHAWSKALDTAFLKTNCTLDQDGFHARVDLVYKQLVPELEFNAPAELRHPVDSSAKQ